MRKTIAMCGARGFAASVALVSIASVPLVAGSGCAMSKPQASLAKMQAGAKAAEPGSIVAVAKEAGSFGTLLAAAQTAGLAELLSSGGPFTVFAPTDAAFAELGEEKINALLKAENRAKLQAVLAYHLVPGEVYSGQLSDGAVQTVNGGLLDVDVRPGEVALNEAASVSKADIKASNGVIHVVDKVLMPTADIPTTLTKAKDFGTLLTAIGASNLQAGALAGEGPFTVFAPTDAAFAKIPQGDLNALISNPSALTEVLGLHVIPGAAVYSNQVPMGTVQTLGGQEIRFSVSEEGTVMINGQAAIISTDILTSNGVIHVIDSVVTSPASQTQG